MSTKIEDIVVLFLLPVVRFCFQRGLDANRFADFTKRAYLKVAEAELQGSEITVSRLHLATGIDRRAIKQLLKPKEKQTDAATTQDIRGRVVTLWQQSKRFQDEKGNPRPLSYENSGSDFHRLCSRVTQSVNPASILFELERSGAVEKQGDRLVLRRYNSPALPDSLEGYEQVSKDLDLVVNAGSANIERKDRIANLHIRTEFDNIYVKDLARARIWLLEQGKDIHRRLRSFLAECDKDLSPGLEANALAGAKVTLVTASLTSQLPAPEESAQQEK